MSRSDSPVSPRLRPLRRPALLRARSHPGRPASHPIAAAGFRSARLPGDPAVRQHRVPCRRRHHRPAPGPLHADARRVGGVFDDRRSRPGNTGMVDPHDRRGYESSIACGYALVMTGLTVLLSAMHDPDQPNRWMLALGAFCLAAAVGARPHLFVAGAYLVLTGYFIARSRRRAGATSGLGLDLVALTGPYLFVGALLGAYNLARFGSLTEFGTQYQLSYWNLRTYPLVKLSYLAPNLWDYLVALPLARCQVAILLPAGEHQHPGPGDPWAFPRGGCGCVAPLPGDSRRPHHLCRQRTQDVAKGQTAHGTTWDSRSCWR